MVVLNTIYLIMAKKLVNYMFFMANILMERNLRQKIKLK